MSTANPIARSARRQDLTATAGQTLFGPLNFKIYDALDIRVFLRDGTGRFRRVTPADYSVVLVGSPDFPSVAFAIGRTSGEVLRFAGARLHEREIDVSLAGVLRTAPLERELDAQTVIFQELRRDVDEAGDTADVALDVALEAKATADQAALDIIDLNARVDMIDGTKAIEASLLAIQKAAESAASADESEASAVASAASADGAEVERVAAQIARLGAENARDAAMVGSTTFSDDSAGWASGRASVADGQYFKTLGTGDVAFKLYRRDTSATHTYITSIPNSAVVEDIRNDAKSLGLRLSRAASLGLSTLDQSLLFTNGNGIHFDIVRKSFVYGQMTKNDINDFAALTSSRASAANALTKAGLTQTFSTNVLRVTDRGAILEPAATQLSASPTDFASWLPSVVGVALVKTGGFAPAIDVEGVRFWTKFLQPASGTCTNGVYINQSFTPGVRSFSFLVAQGDEPYNVIELAGGGMTQVIDYHINWNGGSPIFTRISGNVVGTPTMEVLANGAVRIKIACDILTTANVSRGLRRANSTAPISTAGANGSCLIRIAHEQIEDGAVTTSPIFTGGGTRAADVAALALEAGSTKDRGVFLYEGGQSLFLRSDLVSSSSINLMSSVGAPWMAKYITSITWAPYFDKTLLDPTPNGATAFMGAWEGSYIFDGLAYPSEAEAVSAAGGSGSGSSGTLLLAKSIPTQDNILGAVDFTIDTQRFASRTNGTASIDSGYLKMTTGPSNPSAISRQLKTTSGRGLRLKGIVKKFVGSTACNLAFSSYNSNFGIRALSANVTASTDTPVEVFGSGNSGNTIWVGLCQPLGASGETGLKSPVLEYCDPTVRWPYGNLMFRNKITVGGSLPPSTVVLWQGDDESETNRELLEFRADGTLYLRRTINNTSQTLLLATLAINTTYKVAWGFKNSWMGGAVGGVGAELNASTGSVGYTSFRGGRNSAGASINTYATITDWLIYDKCETLDWMVQVTGASAVDPRKLWMIGDSYSENSSTGLMPLLVDEGWDIISSGVGGTTEAAQYTVLTTANNITDYGPRSLLWWDGDPNGRAAGAVFTASIAGNTMIVTSVASGTLAVGQIISNASGLVSRDTIITADLGGGSYTVSGAPQTVASTSMNGWNEFIRYQAGVAGLGHNRHGYIRSGLVGPQRVLGGLTPVTAKSQETVDMETLYKAISDKYGAAHVYSPYAIVAQYAIQDPSNPGYAADQSDLAFGYFPRSTGATETPVVHRKVSILRAIAKDMRPWLEALVLL